MYEKTDSFIIRMTVRTEMILFFCNIKVTNFNCCISWNVNIYKLILNRELTIMISFLILLII